MRLLRRTGCVRGHGASKRTSRGCPGPSTSSLIGWWLNEAAKSPRLECPLQHQPGPIFVSRFEVEIEAFVVLRKTRELRMSSSQIGADDACFDFKTRGWARPTAVALSGALETSIRSCRQGGREGRSTNAYILFFKWSTRWCAEVLSCGC